MDVYPGITVVELPSFIKSSEKIMSEEEVNNLIFTLSQNPKAGNIIPNTGGLRKFRYKINNNKGKSGGSRVIYYYHNNNNPLLLLFTYPKSKSANLTKEQEKILKIFVKKIVDEEFK